MRKEKMLIAYDWNGTLFDDAKAVWESWNAAFSQFGKSITFGQFQESFDQPIDRFCQNVGFDAGFGAVHTPKILEVVHKTYIPKEQITGLREGAKEMLEEHSRQGNACIILSNHIKSRIASRCEQLGIVEHITAILANKDVEEQAKKKPKIDWLLDYCRQNNYEMKGVVIIGDSPEEIRLAHKYGMIGVAITGGFVSERRLLAERPHHVITSLRQISAVIDTLGPQG